MKTIDFQHFSMNFHGFPLKNNGNSWIFIIFPNFQPWLRNLTSPFPKKRYVRAEPDLTTSVTNIPSVTRFCLLFNRDISSCESEHAAAAAPCFAERRAATSTPPHLLWP